MQAQIAITKIWPPSPGKTNYNVVGSDGAKYSTGPIWIDSLHLEAGMHVAVDYKMGNGAFANTRLVEKISLLSHDGHNGSTPATAPPQTAQPSRAPHNSQSRDMFIMGVVGRAMGSGQFAVNDVKLLALAAAEAWDSLNG